MNRKPGLWATAIAEAVMVGLSAWAAPRLPARVPMHWGPSFEVDGYGSRLEALVLLPLITLGVSLLLAFVPRFEPRRRHLAESARAYNGIWIAVLVVLTGVHLTVLLSGLGYEVPVASIVPVLIGVVLVVVGNYLGKLRSTYLAGIRTPWTLTSERSWERTHRLGGRLFAALGLAVLASALVSGAAAFWLMTAGLAVVVLVTVVYSYLVWRDDPLRAER